VIEVLVVDDHPALRAGLTGLLEADGDVRVVASAGGGREGVVLAAEHRPDVVLIDLEMPDLDGAAATRRIVAANPAARIVVLTSFGDRERILEALEAGAIGYLLKDTEPGELLRAVRAAAAGQAPLDPRAARELLASRRDRDATAVLTDREREIVALVAAGHANKVIALRLGISHKTVRNTLSAAFAKIGVSDRTQAALWAQRAGLRRPC
jgi:DNA-binding NarL/FixJ family response regulator